MIWPGDIRDSIRHVTDLTVTEEPVASPEGGGAVVAGELGGPVEGDGYGQDVDGAVMVGGAPDPGWRQGRGGALPELPSARGVEAAAHGAGAQGAEVVGGADDPLEFGHHRGSVALAAAVGADRDALDVAGAQGAAVAQQAPLDHAAVRDQLAVL